MASSNISPTSFQRFSTPWGFRLEAAKASQIVDLPQEDSLEDKKSVSRISASSDRLQASDEGPNALLKSLQTSLSAVSDTDCGPSIKTPKKCEKKKKTLVRSQVYASSPSAFESDDEEGRGSGCSQIQKFPLTPPPTPGPKNLDDLFLSWDTPGEDVCGNEASSQSNSYADVEKVSDADAYTESSATSSGSSSTNDTSHCSTPILDESVYTSKSVVLQDPFLDTLNEQTAEDVLETSLASFQKPINDNPVNENTVEEELLRDPIHCCKDYESDGWLNDAPATFSENLIKDVPEIWDDLGIHVISHIIEILPISPAPSKSCKDLDPMLIHPEKEGESRYFAALRVSEKYCELSPKAFSYAKKRRHTETALESRFMCRNHHQTYDVFSHSHLDFKDEAEGCGMKKPELSPLQFAREKRRAMIRKVSYGRKEEVAQVLGLSSPILGEQEESVVDSVLDDFIQSKQNVSAN